MKYAGHFVLSLIAVLALGIGMARAEIPIAVVGPMTGKEATFGAQMRSGPSRRLPTSMPPVECWVSNWSWK